MTKGSSSQKGDSHWVPFFICRKFFAADFQLRYYYIKMKRMDKKILVSGLRATSQPHIGNYLGAMKQFVDLQHDYTCFFFIADLHSLTTPFEPKELRKINFEVAVDYLALGIDPKKAILFLQSQVADHSELSWIFNCLTPLGELKRMTQFKEKSKQVARAGINSGLLNYPVLMAADVLLYKADVVPVGEDQVQHIELARTIARKFNTRFGMTFPEPKPLLSKALRVKSLANPENKMSKTNDEPLYIADTPQEIRRKIKKAVTATDARDVSGAGKAPGVENLFLLLDYFGTQEHKKYFEDGYSKNSLKFSELKQALAEDIINYFAEFREKRAGLLDKPEIAAQALTDGASRARAIAAKTMSEVKEKLGLL